MACPFFEPALDPPPEPWQQRWTHRPRLPLGDCYSGSCHAAAASRLVSEEERELCNHGYARGRCGHFPADAACDAVRFSVIAEEPLRLIYILEKDHAPIEHGAVDFSAPDSLLARQARAFAESYARTRMQSPANDATREEYSSKRTDPSERFPRNGSFPTEQAQVEGNVKPPRKRAKSSAGV